MKWGLRKWWANLDYRIHLFFKSLGWASFLILVGVAVISDVQILYTVLIAPHLAVQFLEPTDWNTIKAIWFAEVPLGYLLSWLLGETKSQKRQLYSDSMQIVEDAMRLRKKGEFQHLRYYYSPLDSKQYILNKDTGIFFELVTTNPLCLYLRALAELDVIEWEKEKVPTDTRNLRDFLSQNGFHQKTDYVRMADVERKPDDHESSKVYSGG